MLMAKYSKLICGEENDSTEGLTDHYSVSPLEEATEHQVAQIVIPGCYNRGNHDTGYVHPAAYSAGEGEIGWQDIAPSQTHMGFSFNTTLTENLLTIGIHPFTSLSENCYREGYSIN